MEGSPQEEAVATDIERESLRQLAEHSLAELKLDPEDLNSFLYAMINTYSKYSFKMPATSRKHLRKMIVLHSFTVSNIAHQENNILADSLRAAMPSEFRELGGFSEDLSDMTKPWQAALSDIRKGEDDPEESEI